MVGMQPVLYHRYPDDEEGEDDDDADDLDASQHAHNYLKAAGYPGAGGGGPQGVADGLGNIDLNDSSSWGPAHDDEHHMEGYVGGEKELVPFSMDAFMDTGTCGCCSLPRVVLYACMPSSGSSVFACMH